MADGVKFVRIRGRIVPIRQKQGLQPDSKAKKVARAVDKTAFVAGAATLLGGSGIVAGETGMSANKFLSQIPELRKVGTQYANAALQFKGSPSSRGAEIAKGFAKDSASAFSKADRYEKVGNFLGKVSSAFGKVHKNKFAIGAGLLAGGLAAGIYGMRLPKKNKK